MSNSLILHLFFPSVLELSSALFRFVPFLATLSGFFIHSKTFDFLFLLARENFSALRLFVVCESGIFLRFFVLRSALALDFVVYRIGEQFKSEKRSRGVRSETLEEEDGTTFFFGSFIESVGFWKLCGEKCVCVWKFAG